jgi:hypothetical protein
VAREQPRSVWDPDGASRRRRILRGKTALKPAFAEIDRLQALESQVAEKVWLAGAPDEIATLVNEVGDGATSEAVG